MPERAPTALGVNTKESVQLEDAAIEVPHVEVVRLKSDPEIDTDARAIAALVPLLTVTVFEPLVAPTSTFPKSSALTSLLKTETPTPVSETVRRGFEVELFAMERVAIRVPITAGVNVMVMLQVASAASVPVHVFVSL